MTAPAAPAHEPLPFRLLVDEAVKRWRRHFKPIYFPIALPVAVLQLLLVGAQAVWLREAMTFDPTVTPDLPALFSGMAAFGCSAMVIGVLVWLAYTVMSLSAVDAAAGRQVDVKARWRFVFRGKVLWTLFLVALCLLGALMLCSVVVASAFLLAGLLGPALGEAGTAVLVVLSVLGGLLLFGLAFLIMIYVFLLLAFVSPVLAQEGLYGGAALRRSVELVRYNPQRRLNDHPMFKVFLIFLIGFAISVVVSLLVQVPTAVVEQIMFFRSGPEVIRSGLWLALRAPTQLVSSLISSAVQLYMNFALALLYLDIRQRREGLDLEAAIDQLAGPGVAPEGLAPEGSYR